ncbi:2,3-bisphosphoglycerate-independent phosphoglycerate mutase [Myxozyma melibiosi]|uniref:phosphoglycerate mutase (2,3-diphosphoglycerate-independent) n=1 Tax=Myxozyma melibiosi TaxID=54550 RepID=A0ABR1F5D3_9ASCO
MAVDKKACLIVIDGWGVAPEKGTKGNAIENADTPTMDGFTKIPGYTELEASSTAVGLPEGLMGNSEVGHLNIGAGRVVWQDVVRIDMTMKKHEFGKTANIAAAMEKAKASGRLHLLGLLSDGGVHSHQNHLFELLAVAKEYGVPKVYVHAFGDGRDTDPKGLAGYMKTLLDKFAELGVGELATVVGRYYAMDRDKRWDRVEIAVKALVSTEGGKAVEQDSIIDAINAGYEDGENDEFIKPLVVNGDDARIKAGDTLFFFNYRSDRVREITQLFGVDSSPIDTEIPKDLSITTMTQYKADYPFPVAFPPQKMDDVLAEWLGKQNVAQVHVAETEKYAHVTFFFNGGVEKQFALEQRDMVPSPRVATYDLLPKMSQHEVAEQVAKRLGEQKFPFVMCNLAAPDMVGHTGVYDAAVEAVTHCDAAIKAIYDACVKEDYVLFVTADHGNAEEMITPEGRPKTSHTTNKVPFVMANAPETWSLEDGGVLGDVAPTVLAVMGIEQPEHMTGRSLLQRK